MYERGMRGGLIVSSTRDRVVRVWVLAGDIVLCSWARHLTLTVPPSTQVYKWVPANNREFKKRRRLRLRQRHKAIISLVKRA